MTFIRAPYVESVREDVKILARVQNRIVAVRYGINWELRFIRNWIQMIGYMNCFLGCAKKDKRSNGHLLLWMPCIVVWVVIRCLVRFQVGAGIFVTVHHIQRGHIVPVTVDTVEPDIDPQQDGQSDGGKKTTGKKAARIPQIQTGHDQRYNIHGN